MSIGNLKTDGGKGTNWPWQYKMLKGLQGIIDVINSTANGSEYEAKLVNITCTGVPFNGTELYLEVRVWDTVTGGFTGNPTYYLPGSTVGVPLATFTDAGCDIDYLEAGDATEATLQAILTQNTQIEVNTSPVTGVTPTLDRVAVNTGSPIAAGARSVSIANVGAEDGLVLGTVLASGETITFDAGSLNNTLGAITYDPTSDGVGVTATTFLIATLT